MFNISRQDEGFNLISQADPLALALGPLGMACSCRIRAFALSCCCAALASLCAKARLRFAAPSPGRAHLRRRFAPPGKHSKIKKLYARFGHTAFFWRRVRDSNPRRLFRPHEISSFAPSTTRTTLQNGAERGCRALCIPL